MFQRIKQRDDISRPEVSFQWMGKELKARAGDTVAAALLAAGVRSTRSHPVTDEPRAPYCMMGTCFECLVEIDFVPNQQACQVRVTEGMQINPQLGART